MKDFSPRIPDFPGASQARARQQNFQLGPLPPALTEALAPVRETIIPLMTFATTVSNISGGILSSSPLWLVGGAVERFAEY